MIGALVGWSQVPSGSLVRGERSGSWYVRIGDRGWCVYAPSEEPPVWCAYAHYPSGARDDAGWPWGRGSTSNAPLMHIAARDLTGDETAEHLQALAAAFDQRFPWEGA